MESPECDLFRVLRKAKGMQLINGKEELFAKVMIVCKKFTCQMWVHFQDVFVLKTCFRKNVTVEENIH